MVGDRGAKRYVVPVRLAGAALLGLLAALALGSCGGDGEAIGTGAGTLSLTGASLPARTAPVVTATGRDSGQRVTETGGAVPLTETAAARPRRRRPRRTRSRRRRPVGAGSRDRDCWTVTVTTTEGVNPAAAAAAAAASEDDDGLTSTEWGWVAFALLAAAVVVGGIVWWLRKRSAAAKQADEALRRTRPADDPETSRAPPLRGADGPVDESISLSFLRRARGRCGEVSVAQGPLPARPRSPHASDCVETRPCSARKACKSSGLDESPHHPEARSCVLAKRHERHNHETGGGQRHERAELGLQRVEIVIETLSLGGDLFPDLRNVRLLRHGPRTSSASGRPPRQPARVLAATPCERNAPPGRRRLPRRGTRFPPRSAVTAKARSPR